MSSRSRVIGVASALAMLSAFGALAREPMSDAQVRQAIIEESIARYRATGHPCACPYNMLAMGRVAAVGVLTADRAALSRFAFYRM
jgi:hypothetical protein